MSLLTLEKEDGIAEIHLHINKANSYDLDFYKEFNSAINEIRFDEDIAVALVISDQDSFFSSGADVNFLKESEPPFKTQFCLFCNETLDKISRSPQVFIACIEGHCIGGGLEMALGCDLRFMGEEAGMIGVPEVNLGVLPGTGGTQRLARVVGASTALDLCATGKRISPAEAKDIGLINRVFPQDETLEKTREYAENLANSATYAVQNIKMSIMNGIEMPLNYAIRYEAELQNLLFKSDDAMEGMQAFLEDREPDFSGE